MQDTDPIPWGALDRFQAHFIVRKDPQGDADYVARTILETRGHFASKVVASVSWNGPGALAVRLNQDGALNELISKQSPKDATIYVEPTDGAVRIRSKWDNHLSFGITKELYDIYDHIAGHIKSI